MNGRPGGASVGLTYLQLAQVQVEPQLQLTQVQFGLLHFTLLASWLFVVIDFIIYILIVI